MSSLFFPYVGAFFWVGVLLSFAAFLRSRVTFFQKNLIPSALIGGVIGFVLMNFGLIGMPTQEGWKEIPTSAFGVLVSHLFVFGFIGIGLIQQDEPEDFVISTGNTYEIREFVSKTFSWLGISIEFVGKDESEIGRIKEIDQERLKELNLNSESLKIGNEVIAVDTRYYRPTEVELLVGDSSKAKKKLNWTPKYDIDMLVDDMISSDLNLMKKDEYLKDGGYVFNNYFE